MIHRALFAPSATGILLEHYGASARVATPVQMKVLTISSDAYAREVLAAAAGLRAEDDLRNEKINYKVREHSLQKIPPCLSSVNARRKAARSPFDVWAPRIRRSCLWTRQSPRLSKKATTRCSKR